MLRPCVPVAGELPASAADSVVKKICRTAFAWQLLCMPLIQHCIGNLQIGPGMHSNPINISKLHLTLQTGHFFDISML